MSSSQTQNPNPILQVFNPEDYPTLDLGAKCGNTGYIDFIQSADMTHPIMSGIDICGRQFIAIKCIVEFKKSEDSDEKNSYEMVGTFFQRYSDNSSVWAYGTCYSLGTLFHDARVRMEHYAELPIRLNAIKEGKTLRCVSPFDEPYDWVNGNSSAFISLAPA
jgi:hypothetical protein